MNKSDGAIYHLSDKFKKGYYYPSLNGEIYTKENVEKFVQHMRDPYSKPFLLEGTTDDIKIFTREGLVDIQLGTGILLTVESSQCLDSFIELLESL